MGGADDLVRPPAALPLPVGLGMVILAEFRGFGPGLGAERAHGDRPALRGTGFARRALEDPVLAMVMFLKSAPPGPH